MSREEGFDSLSVSVSVSAMTYTYGRGVPQIKNGKRRGKGESTLSRNIRSVGDLVYEFLQRVAGYRQEAERAASQLLWGQKPPTRTWTML